MSNPIVFIGCEAFVCEVKGEKLCTAWLQDPRGLATPFDATKTITVDMTKTPALAATTADIEVDNHRFATTNAGLTSIGPAWPMTKNYIGGLWLREDLYDAAVLANKVTAWTNRYQFTTLLYLSGGVARRYSGYHAELLAIKSGKSIFRVWNALDDVGITSTKIVEVDMSSSTQVDAAMSHAFTTVGQTGKLFLSWDELQNQPMLVSPKLPIGEGGGESFAVPSAQREAEVVELKKAG